MESKTRQPVLAGLNNPVSGGIVFLFSD